MLPVSLILAISSDSIFDALRHVGPFVCMQLLAHAWRAWMSRCEEKEELCLMLKTRSARQLHSLHLYRNMFQQWQQYTAWRRQRKVRNCASVRVGCLKQASQLITKYWNLQRLIRSAAELSWAPYYCPLFYDCVDVNFWSERVRLCREPSIVAAAASMLQRMALFCWNSATQATPGDGSAKLQEVGKLRSILIITSDWSRRTDVRFLLCWLCVRVERTCWRDSSTRGARSMSWAKTCACCSVWQYCTMTTTGCAQCSLRGGLKHSCDWKNTSSWYIHT